MEEDQKEQGESKKNKNNLYYPWLILVACICALGFFAYTHYLASHSTPSYKIGVVNEEALISEHRDYPSLAKLEQELEALQQRAKVIQGEIAGLNKLDLKQEIFHQALQTQEDLVDFQRRNDLNNEKISQRAKLVQKYEPALNEEIYGVNQQFGAKIVTIQLKLDNRDKMLLTAQELNKLNGDLHELEMQRYQAVSKVRQKYDQLIGEELAAWEKQRWAELGLRADHYNQVLAEQNAQGLANANKETKELTDQLNKVMALKSQLMDINMEVKAKQRDLELLKQSIIADIASFATKVAIQDKYDLVMTKKLNKENPLDGEEVIKAATDITTQVAKAMAEAGLIVK